MKTYTFRSFKRVGRKWHLMEHRTDVHAAQVGGLLAHAMEDVDKVYVDDDQIGSVLVYRKDGKRIR